LFNADDLAQLKAHGIDEAEARRQAALLASPPAPMRLTRPCTVEPTGITVLPSSITASTTRPEKASPSLLEKVDSVFSSLTLKAVPAGRAMLLCAPAATARHITPSTASIFFIPPPEFPLQMCPPGRKNPSTGHR